MQCLFMVDKRKYFKLQQEEIAKIKQSGKKPSLLLHVCCGPCTSGPLLVLAEIFEVTLTYNNSNIFPKSEWQRRLWTLEEMLKKFERKYGHKINLVAFAYDETYQKEVLSPYADEKEGGKRCHICFENRMKEAFAFAQENGFEYFTTVMSISRQKDAIKLNEIGEKLASLFPKTKYFYSDFKKGNGQIVKDQLTKEFELYNQNYCGCIYTYKDGQKRNEAALAKQKAEELKNR